MKIQKEAQIRWLARMLLAGALALLSIVCLSLLFSRFQAVAQPAIEIAALSVQKEANTDIAAPGDVLTYTITIQDSIPPAGDVWLTDTLPAELDCITESLTDDLWGSSFGVKDNVITWTATMYGNQTAIITFSARITSEIVYAEIENTAWISSADGLISDTESTTVAAYMGNLDNAATYKTVSSDKAEPGDVLTYTIWLFNDDADYQVFSPQLTDPLHPALTCIPSSLNASQGIINCVDDQIVWTHSEVPSFQTILLHYSAQMSNDYEGWITNTAEIITPGSSFTRTAGTRVQRRYPHLEASKSVYPEQGYRGEYLTYTVRITNTGDAAAETVWMTDELMPVVSYAPGTLDATMGSFGESDGVITWNLTLVPTGTLLLPSQGKAALTFTVQVSPELNGIIHFTNTANITGTGILVPATAETTAIGIYKIWMPLTFHNYPPTPVLNPIPATGNHSYTVSWQPVEIPGVDRYVLQQARSSDFSIVDWSWETSSSQTSQYAQNIYCAYYYRVRADDDSSWGQGPWSNVEQGEASPPDPPTLAITAPTGDNSYTVSWSPVSVSGNGVAIDRYRLQESTDPNFASLTGGWLVAETSKLVQKGSSYGTFYYRVRAEDDDCWGAGPWSNIESAELTYRDDFSSATSWAYRRGDDIIKEENGFRIRYRDGKMYLLFVGSYDFAVASPMVTAPLVPYTIGGKVRLVDGESFDDRDFSIKNGTTFGITFGGNSGSPCPADRRTDKYKGCLSHYYRLMLVYDVHYPDGFAWQLKRIDYHDREDAGAGRGPKLISGSVDLSPNDADDWNTWKIEVTDSNIKIYVNDKYLGKTTDTSYINDPYFGLYFSSPDIGDTGVKWDWFEVK